MIGKRVRFKRSPESDFTMPPALVGATGTVVGKDEGKQYLHWHVELDKDIPGFYSGKSWAETDELEMID